jgi:ankyrin repeat protein
MLIKIGSAVDAATRNGITALHIAAQNGSLAILSALVEAGCQINPEWDTGETPLIAAVQHGQEECAKRLLQFGARANHKMSRDGATAMFVAASEGKVKLVTLLAANGANALISRNDGISPLYIATERGHAHCVKLLIDAGACAKASTKRGVTALYTASSNGAAECVRVLLESGAAFDTRVKDGTTALFAACKNYKITCAKLLLAAGASVSVVRKDGISLMQIARASSNKHGDGGELTALLAAMGADIAGEHEEMVLMSQEARMGPVSGRLGDSLLEAIRRGNESIVLQWLADPLTHINDTSGRGETALIVSAASDSRQAVTARLVQGGADLEASVRLDSSGESSSTALQIACRANCTETVAILLRAGANANHTSHGAQSIVLLTALKGYDKCLALALEYGAYVHPSSLHAVAERGAHQSMARLIDYGADVDARQVVGSSRSRGLTPLAIVCTRGDLRSMAVLIRAEARMDLRFNPPQGTSATMTTTTTTTTMTTTTMTMMTAPGVGPAVQGATVLHIAAKCGHPASIKVLVGAGADVDAQTTGPEQLSAVHIAIYNDRVDGLLQLIMAGADVSAANGQGLTPLHCCCVGLFAACKIDCLRLLIKANAHLDTRADGTGWSALHFAAHAGEYPACEMLLKAGADRNSLTMSQASPLLLAAMQQHTQVVELLVLKYKADPNCICLSPEIAPLTPGEMSGGVADRAGSTALDFLIEQGASTELIAAMKGAGAVAPTCEPSTLVGTEIEIDGTVARVGQFLSTRSFFSILASQDQGLDPGASFMLNYSGGIEEQVVLLRAGNDGKVYKVISKYTHLHLEREYWTMNVEAAVAHDALSGAYGRIVAVLNREDMQAEIDVQRCCIDHLLHSLLEVRPTSVEEALAQQDEVAAFVQRVQSTFADDDELCEQCVAIQKILRAGAAIAAIAAIKSTTSTSASAGAQSSAGALQGMVTLMTQLIMGQSTAIPSLLTLGTRALFGRLELVAKCECECMFMQKNDERMCMHVYVHAGLLACWLAACWLAACCLCCLLACCLLACC